MSVFKSTLGDMILARISLGSVPVDGQYGFEAARWQESARRAAKSDSATSDVTSKDSEDQWCASC